MSLSFVICLSEMPVYQHLIFVSVACDDLHSSSERRRRGRVAISGGGKGEDELFWQHLELLSPRNRKGVRVVEMLLLGDEGGHEEADVGRRSTEGTRCRPNRFLSNVGIHSVVVGHSTVLRSEASAESRKRKGGRQRTVGRSPYRPVIEAGARIDPPISVPTPMNDPLKETSADSPPELPPEVNCRL